ncbi:peroxidase-like [Oratosquilla oratoria]|uniref:peroxidase-like n=1 Tax=Oratosquilla oratoria TaxID=337810 RepID=UPI003F7754D3
MEPLKLMLLFMTCWMTSVARVGRFSGAFLQHVPDVNSVQELQDLEDEEKLRHPHRLDPAVPVKGFQGNVDLIYLPEEELAKEGNPFWELVNEKPRQRIDRTLIKPVPFVYPAELACKKEKKDLCNKPDQHKYRSLSGHCNNERHPNFGSADIAMPRLLDSIGNDAFFNQDGSFRPNPRKISLRVRKLHPRPRPDASLMVMQFGQFIDHDHIITEPVRRPGHKPHRCRPCSSWRAYPECAPIPSEEHSKCIEFIRNAHDGSLRQVHGQHGKGDQVNRNTGLLDLSVVYGSSSCTMSRLRQFDGGLMQIVRGERGAKMGLLPLRRREEFEDCRNSFHMCFLSGDTRANEHNGLLVLHTILVNEHNRIAAQLHKINVHWDDEKLFQEARKINIAQMQHVLYSEFLPVVLGERMMNDPEYNLRLGKFSEKDYDFNKNPGVLNEFATAAFRFGHTLVPERFYLLDENFVPVYEQLLVKMFFNTAEMRQVNSGQECHQEKTQVT